MLRFHVPAMTCNGCARAVSQAILGADPQARVNTFPAIRRVDVETGLKPAQLLAAIDEAGYGQGAEEVPHEHE